MFIESAVNIVYEEREFFRTYVELLSHNASDPEVKKMITTFYNLFMEQLVKLLKDGIRAGIFINFDTEKLARAIYFICGPLPMIHAVTKALAELNVPAKQIYVEQYEMA